MSAIVGIRQMDGQTVPAPALYRMLQAMAHRSPGGTSVWHQGSIGLGYGQFQALPDDLAGMQPLVDGPLMITADARLDNRDELLKALGLADRETSDAALILAAYRRWGEDCPKRLLGDFAFALWDEQRATLFCARDHFGIKPFYYHGSAERFVVASEIKALLALPSVPREINEEWVADFLVAIVADSSSTIYSDIFRLPPGHRLVVTPFGRQLQPYWRLEVSDTVPRGDLAEQFHSVFSAAVSCRLRGSAAVGVMLSGGLDSSSIACVAARIRQAEQARPLPTFSRVFDKTPDRSERPFVEAVVAQGGFDPYFLASDQSPAFADFEQILAVQDGPFLAPGLALNSQVYHAAADRGVRVLLDGHGGDEVVSHGFGLLKELATAGKWMDLWREVRGEAEIYGTPTWQAFALYVSHFGPSGRVLLPAGRVVQRALRRLRRLRRGEESGPLWNRFINPDLAARTDVAARCRADQASMVDYESERELHLGAVRGAMQPYALEVLDKAAASAGVEARYPFWDKRMVEFCLALPADAKLSDGWPRMILRRAMEGILPKQVQWRKDKLNFLPHLVEGMLAHHRSMLDHILLEDAEDMRGYVDLEAVVAAYRRMVQKPEAASYADVHAVWRTVVLALWLRQRRAVPTDAVAVG
jgi:asparagine synthase (glutamine-hydrolysing)